MLRAFAQTTLHLITSRFTHRCCTQNICCCCWQILRTHLHKKLGCKWVWVHQTLSFDAPSSFAFLITSWSCSLQSSSPQQHSSSTGDPHRHLCVSLELHGWPCSCSSSVSSMCICAQDSKSRHRMESCRDWGLSSYQSSHWLDWTQRQNPAYQTTMCVS